MHTTMVPEQVKTMKIQAGIQVSRRRKLRRQLQLWKRFRRLYLIVFVLVRNIFWKTVRRVSDTKETIRFKLDTQEITYTVDIFRDTLKLPVKTFDNLFITPVTIRTIESFLQMVGYQGVVDKLFHAAVNRTNVDYAALLWWDFMNNVFQKKNVFQYPRFTKLIIVDLMKKYPSIPQIHDEDYHTIKDVCWTTPRAYMTPTLTAASPYGKKRKQGAGETSLPRKSLKVTIRRKKQSTPSIPPPSDDRERDKIDKATILSLTLHKAALAAEAQESNAKVQKKLVEEEIENMVEGEEDEESYVSEFVDSMLNDDVDDSHTRIEPEKEVTAPVSPTTATTFKTKFKRGFTSNKTKMLPGSIDGMRRRRVLDHCNNVVPEMTFTNTNEMIKNEMPRLINLAINKDRKVDPINVPALIFKEFATHGPKMIEELFKKHMQNTTLNLYPTTSSSTADLQQQLYLNMKSKTQDQTADP
ncbi:hypothetical protein Tco_0568546 [Tanacetum coccineum]